MSGRSSARELVATALAVAAAVPACKHPAPKKPEADPAQFVALAKRISRDVPPPGAVPDCKPNELVGATFTLPTLHAIAQVKDAPSPQLAAWINPPELDSPAARVLADPKATPLAARQAAAELLAAPAYLEYRVDAVNAPIALGIKDPKIGTIGARLLRYDRTGKATCVIVYSFQDDPQVGARLVAESDRAAIDAKVMNAMRDDLRAQYLINAPRAHPAGTRAGSAK